MNQKELPFDIGSSYLIRTVTYHVVGRVMKVSGDFLVLESASWVADSGRFGEAIAKGNLDEVEFAGPAFVNTNAITDAYPWTHDLPNKTK